VLDNWVVFSEVSQGLTLLWFGGEVEVQMLDISGSYKVEPAEEEDCLQALNFAHRRRYGQVLWLRTISHE
jgi:hypothetical protein